jgi:hypothetical protein
MFTDMILIGKRFGLRMGKRTGNSSLFPGRFGNEKARGAWASSALLESSAETRLREW